MNKRSGIYTCGDVQSPTILPSLQREFRPSSDFNASRSHEVVDKFRVL